MLFSSFGKNTNFILLMYLGLVLVHMLVSPRLTKPRSSCTYFIYCTYVSRYRTWISIDSYANSF